MPILPRESFPDGKLRRQQPMQMPMGVRILRRQAVTEKTGLERSAIYDRMRKGTFPKQVRLGPKSVGWLESEIDRWIVEQVAARDAGASA